MFVMVQGSKKRLFYLVRGTDQILNSDFSLSLILFPYFISLLSLMVFAGTCQDLGLLTGTMIAYPS